MGESWEKPRASYPVTSVAASFRPEAGRLTAQPLEGVPLLPGLLLRIAGSAVHEGEGLRCEVRPTTPSSSAKPHSTRLQTRLLQARFGH